MMFAFVLLLSILIFVHELGHFVVAKACGVRVLKFSLGFGPPIGFGPYRMRWVRGHTEYVVAWFPLGGFVKMLGENPDETDDPALLAHPDETLGAKPTWQKLAIVFAGPAMNLLLPVFVFMGSLAVGLPRPLPEIGLVEPGSPGAQAGLRAGDVVKAVGGEPVAWWDEFDDAVRESPGDALRLTVERDGAVEEVALDVAVRPTMNEFGERVDLGWAGAGHRRLSAVVGVPDQASPAHRAGIRSGEVVSAVDGTPVEDWEGLREAYAAASGEVALTLQASLEEGAETRRVNVPAEGDLEALGLVPANVLIRSVREGSPADRGGLREGDLILSVDGEPVGSFGSFAETVRTSEGRALRLAYARNGRVTTVSVAPELDEIDAAGLGIKEPRYLVGIAAEVSSLRGSVGRDQERNPLVAGPRSVRMTVDYTANFLQGLSKLITGEVSRKQLAGPIGIASIAGRAFEMGWEVYLSVLVLISINLGILNLLPIPILDGGQAVIFAVEGIRRAPLSLRTREIFQQIGFTVLVLLMGLAFWNDLSRHWSDLLSWLSRSVGS
ncbi:MAG: RIP metalloprotease RseP [Myxococcota bacterium]